MNSPLPVTAPRWLMAIVVVVFLGLVVLPGCGVADDYPMVTVWDSAVDAGEPPRGFYFVTVIDPAAPVAVDRFVLTSWREWTSVDAAIGSG